MGVKGHILLLKELMRLEFATAMEYRFNFISQTAGMLVNDGFWMFFWLLFFQRFQTINGWAYREMVLTYAVLVTAYGIVSTVFGNWNRLSKMIEDGRVDYYLSLPKNVLFHQLIRLSYGGFGDFLFGITLAFFVVPLKSVLLFILLVALSAVLQLSWWTLVGSLSFFFGRFEHASKILRESFLTLSFYPFSVYSGTVRFVLLFVIPAGFAAGIPVELLKVFQWKWFLLFCLVTVILAIIALVVYALGLKRYESGNVIAMRG